MSEIARVQSKGLFHYELKGEPNDELKAELEAEGPVPELSLDGDWTPAAYKQVVTDMMKAQYDSTPEYYASLDQCRKEEVMVPPRDGNDASVRVWVYRPLSLKDDDAAPAIIYSHGGGSVAGCLEDMEPYLAQMAVQTGTVVCGVGYRMVPDIRFPYTMLDTYAGAKHVIEAARSLRIDPARIALSGDSAGGYQVLATVAKMAQNDEGHLLKLARISVAQIFDYFLTVPKEEMTTSESDAIQESVAIIDWMVGDKKEQFLREKNPLLFPGLASDELLAKYPPFIVIENEFDNYRTPSESLAARLRGAGRLLEYICYPGCGHVGGHPNTQSDLTKMYDVYLK